MPQCVSLVEEFYFTRIIGGHFSYLGLFGYLMSLGVQLDISLLIHVHTITSDTRVTMAIANENVY
jgi:hypothetical protein